jgi:hypothetical protein
MLHFRSWRCLLGLIYLFFAVSGVFLPLEGVLTPTIPLAFGGCSHPQPIPLFLRKFFQNRLVFLQKHLEFLL